MKTEANIHLNLYGHTNGFDYIMWIEEDDDYGVLISSDMGISFSTRDAALDHAMLEIKKRLDKINKEN